MKYIYYFGCSQLVLICLDGNLSISNKKLQSFFNERGENENILQLIFYTYIERKLLFQQMKALRLQLQGPSSHLLWLKNRNDFFKIINKARGARAGVRRRMRVCAGMGRCAGGFEDI